MAEGIYHVMDNYYIGADSMCYTVYEEKWNSKKKEFYMEALTYHGNLQDALKSLHRIAVLDSLSACEGELRDMLNIYSSVTEKLSEGISRALQEISVGTGEEHA